MNTEHVHDKQGKAPLIWLEFAHIAEHTSRNMCNSTHDSVCRYSEGFYVEI